MPSRIKKCHGGKLGQENVTVLVAGNKDGSKDLAISNWKILHITSKACNSHAHIGATKQPG
jgi:hypothetical protein